MELSHDAAGPGRRMVALGMVTAAVTAAMSIGSAAHAAPAEGTIRGSATQPAVAGSYVVVLADTIGAAAVGDTVDALAARYGGTVGYRYTSTIKGFSVRLSEARARQLAADPRVDFVERDTILTTQETQPDPPSWGLDRIDQRDLPLDRSYTYPNAGENVHAYIIDTGINLTHTDFGGRATSGRDTVDNDDDATDCHGHGTHVAGTVGGTAHGVAKNVRLVAVRVLNCQGSGSNAGVIAGIEWVTANAVRPAVANMSLGGGANDAVDNAVRASIDAGIVYSLAAGNGNGQPACTTSPARTEEAITVSATTSADGRAGFANIGTCVDIFAPGQGITSAWIGGSTATNTISGTSMAAPHVAGAAALILAGSPTLTPEQVRDTMVARATPGKVTDIGAGSPNLLLHVAGVPSPLPPPLCAAHNSTDVAIRDRRTATSTITISYCERNASATSTVEVQIKHTHRGSLRIDLVAPDGSSYRLKNTSGDSGDDIDASYVVDLSREAGDGAWRLRVYDSRRGDVGFVDGWTLRM